MEISHQNVEGGQKMNQKVNQADSLRAALGKTEGHLHSKGDEPDEPVVRVAEKKAKAPPHRKDKKIISGHFPKKIHQQLKMVAIEQETDIQSLLGEGLDLLFEKYDKPLIAQLLGG